jgi:REP element-mobilizing transposase RayT
MGPYRQLLVLFDSQCQRGDKGHVSRAVRIDFDGAYYHVMSRGVARMPTFLDDEDRRRLLEIIGELVDRGDFEVHAFCLMPNHYHLLVCTPHGGLSRWMRHVNGDYVRWFNIRHRRVGHLWQGRYKAILVRGRCLPEGMLPVHPPQSEPVEADKTGPTIPMVELPKLRWWANGGFLGPSSPRARGARR